MNFHRRTTFRRSILTVMVLVSASSTSLRAAAASSEEVLRASPFGPPGHLLNTQVLAGWADAVARSTHGRVRVEILERAVAPPGKVLDAIAAADADVSIVSNGAAGRPLLLNALVEFAAQTPDAERASVAYQHVVTRHPSFAADFGDVELIAVFTHGPGAMLLTKRGMTAGDALAGTTLHAGGAGAAEVVRAIGATAVVAPGPAAKTLLVERRVDGTVTALETLDGFDLAPQIDEVVLMPGGFYCAGFALVMNRTRWAALSADDRAAIRAVSGESLSRRAGRAWDVADRAALDAARRRGLQVLTAPAPLAGRVRAASATREAQWITQLQSSGPEAREALAEYRAELGVP